MKLRLNEICVRCGKPHGEAWEGKMRILCKSCCHNAIDNLGRHAYLSLPHGHVIFGNGTFPATRGKLVDVLDKAYAAQPNSQAKVWGNLRLGKKSRTSNVL